MFNGNVPFLLKYIGIASLLISVLYVLMTICNVFNSIEHLHYSISYLSVSIFYGAIYYTVIKKKIVSVFLVTLVPFFNYFIFYVDGQVMNEGNYTLGFLINSSLWSLFFSFYFYRNRGFYRK